MTKEEQKKHRDAWRKVNAHNLNKYSKAWRKANPEKAKKACNRWRKANIERVLMQCRKYMEANVINLTDMYIKRAIVRDSGRKSNEVTQPEVILKRQQIMLHRELHKLKRAVNESN